MRRRAFLRAAGRIATVLGAPMPQVTHAIAGHPGNSPEITLFLCGDVMTGRGIDQILGHPGRPELHEDFVKHAGQYVELAERVNGPIPRPVPSSYIWGDVLQEFDRRGPDVRIANLETAVTRSDDFWPGKGIHYRMHPANVSCLTAARFDCCTLANNHVLDWGYTGLAETIDTLRQAGLAPVGAGPNAIEAGRPAVLTVSGKGRVIVVALGSVTSGIPEAWAAGAERAGVNLATSLSDEAIGRVAARVGQVRRLGDLVVLSIHWGANWGYRIPPEHRRFAHALIDAAGVDVVHGHSSHHPLGIEVYRGRPILYGCGDFLNDYEGIGAYEEFRSHLALAYFARMSPAAGLVALFAMPFRIRRFRLARSSQDDARWLKDTLSREGRALGTQVELGDEGTLRVRW
jgi:poly-gamma-glutamate capsule biosynthesis protein CapA/YwtB (metallophosphatase superfamily)